MCRWIGEAVVRISLDADTATVSRCQCCLRCVTKCIWCFGAAGHWLVLVITYLMVIFAIVVVVITVFLAVFLALVLGLSPYFFLVFLKPPLPL